MKVPVTIVGMLAVCAPALALAQNQLPETMVKRPRAAAPVTSQRLPAGAPDEAMTAEQANKHFTNDPSVHYQAPTVARPGDWNAPGVIETEKLTEAQFAQLKALHPTAVFYGRCFTGQDPDPIIRVKMHVHPVHTFCKG